MLYDFVIPNTGNVEGEDSYGVEFDTDDASVTVTKGVQLDRFSTPGKNVQICITNYREAAMIEGL